MEMEKRGGKWERNIRNLVDVGELFSCIFIRIILI